MKFSLSALALGVAVAFGAPAMAFDTATTYQNGSGNDAEITQAYNDSSFSAIDQNGYDHVAKSYQKDNTFASSKISQSDAGNYATCTRPTTTAS